MSDTTGGTYTLLVAAGPAAIDVGALGTHTVEDGWYAYVGSALGSGGFTRIDRHRELAAGKRDTRHWHIDYLLGHPGSRLDAVIRTDGVDGECAIAASLSEQFPSVTAFGCSDCDCQSHLYYSGKRERLVESVRDAHELLDGATVTETE